MAERPTVSVVFPVKDGALFLGGAINSILGQTLEDIELVVVDDASTDETAAIARAAAVRDKRLRFVASEGRGIVDALETGIALTSGWSLLRGWTMTTSPCLGVSNAKWLTCERGKTWVWSAGRWKSSMGSAAY